MIPASEEGYQGILFFLHDFADYAGRHTFLAKGFAEAGYDFYTMDMRGHGKSEGMTAYIEKVQDLVQDFRSFIYKILKTFYS